MFDGIGRYVSEMRALVGIVSRNDPGVGVVGEVGIGSGTVAGERQQLAIGIPRGLGVVVVASSDLGRGLAGKVEGIEMGAAAVEVTDFVFLELQAVNHPGFLSLGLLFLFSARLFVLILTLILILLAFESLGRGSAETR